MEARNTSLNRQETAVQRSRRTFDVVPGSQEITLLISCAEETRRGLLFEEALDSVFTASHHHGIPKALERSTLKEDMRERAKEERTVKERSAHIQKKES